MGLRQYLKINQLFAKLKSLDKKLDENNLDGVETDLKGISEKIDSLSQSDDLNHENIRDIQNKIDLLDSNYKTNCDTTNNHVLAVSNLVQENHNLVQENHNLVQENNERLRGTAEEIHFIKKNLQNGELFGGGLGNKDLVGVYSKLDTIYNNLLTLNNNVSKKDYIINDDRLEILKNLIKDERASDISLDMKFLGSNLSMRIDDSDIRVFKQIFVDNEYDSLNLPKVVDTIVDLGANIGLSALFFMKKYPDARIIAVEPDAVNFEIMKRNLEDYSSHVTLLNAAIWPSDGEVSLVEHDESNEGLGAWGYRTETLTEGAEGSVSAISIPTLMKQSSINYIDILKVDIEGAEYELFEKGYESWLDKVGLIIIETHDRFKPNSEAMVRNALKGRFTELPLKGENLFFKKNS